ncbi:MAG: hypothetical protein ACREUA_05505 [Burkholderiales bacterium]
MTSYWGEGNITAARAVAIVPTVGEAGGGGQRTARPVRRQPRTQTPERRQSLDGGASHAGAKTIDEYA